MANAWQEENWTVIQTLINKTNSVATAWLELNHLVKYLIIIPWARSGYVMMNSQRGASFKQSRIQQVRMK